MIIPWDMLEPDTLKQLIEEFVSRDGTDNGYDESMESKVEKISHQLKTGDLIVVFDPIMDSSNIISKQQAEEIYNNS
ncbi:hypothetical protein CI610_00220 [invertebrate metagenome]|uniref:YheU family protein n=1 Tax=invertebrate metagenome TaxID=1711999 RepID=A0A2H9TC27_9ZZZZ